VVTGAGRDDRRDEREAVRRARDVAVGKPRATRDASHVLGVAAQLQLTAIDTHAKRLEVFAFDHRPACPELGRRTS
jgi:hypothetical protein